MSTAYEIIVSYKSLKKNEAELRFIRDIFSSEEMWPHNLVTLGYRNTFYFQHKNAPFEELTRILRQMQAEELIWEAEILFKSDCAEDWWCKLRTEKDDWVESQTFDKVNDYE